MSESIVVFDWETTSADPATARGVQFAAYHSGEGAWYDCLTNPEVSIHHGAQAIHGISDEMVKDAPKDWGIAFEFSLLVAGSDGIITAGHNSTTFDIPITNRLAKMGGPAVPPPLGQPHIDSMLLAQRVWPTAPSYRLSATEAEAKKPGEIGLIQWLGLGTGEGAHDALADCKMVLQVIEAASLKTGKSHQELAEWMAKPFVHSHALVGKHKGKPWGKGPGCVPLFYAKWCCENWTDASIDMQATILYHYGLSFKFKGAMR